MQKGVRLRTVERRFNGIQAKLQSNQQIQTILAKYVVDASGRQARYLRQLGAQIEQHDRLIGIAALLSPATSKISSTTLVETFDDGWWYTASVPSGGQMVVLMTDADIAREKAYKEPALWAQCLADTTMIKQHLATMTPNTRLNVYAADSHRLLPVADACWLAVGDAASCFDPLLSLGMLKALRSGVLAAYALKDTEQGDVMAMKKYQYVNQQDYQGYLATRADYYGLV